MVSSFLILCQDIGCPVALDKTEWASTTIVFLGVLLDGDRRVIALLCDKVEKALKFLQYVSGVKKTTVRFIQQFTGTLNFLNKAIVPGRAFTMVMYSKLKTTTNTGKKLQPYHHVNLGNDFKNDCKVWEFFLKNASAKELCRPFVDLAITRTNTEILNFYMDASLNQYTGGLGGVFDNRFIYGTWGREFIINEKPSIEFLELFALVAGILTWSDLDDRLQNTRIEVFCDNQSVMYMVNGHGSKCPKCMKLIRLLTLSNIKSNRRVFVRFVRTNDNILADSLSRLQFDRFWREAPETMNAFPDKIPEVMWPVERIWFG